MTKENYLKFVLKCDRENKMLEERNPAFYHVHHIEPVHNGGADTEENKVLLTVEQHTQAHYMLYKLYERREDFEAYHGLKGHLGKEELTYMGALRGLEKQKYLRENDFEWAEQNRKNLSRASTEKWKNSEYREKQLPRLLETQKIATAAAATREAIQKKKETLARIGHQQGKKNNQYGTMWITDGTVDKKIKVGDLIEVGFKPGRKYNQNYGKNPQKTASGKHWNTDGKTEMLVFPETPLPSGFKRGRIVHPNMRRG